LRTSAPKPAARRCLATWQSWVNMARKSFIDPAIRSWGVMLCCITRRHSVAMRRWSLSSAHSAVRVLALSAAMHAPFAAARKPEDPRAYCRRNAFSQPHASHPGTRCRSAVGGEAGMRRKELCLAHAAAHRARQRLLLCAAVSRRRSRTAAHRHAMRLRSPCARNCSVAGCSTWSRACADCARQSWSRAPRRSNLRASAPSFVGAVYLRTRNEMEKTVFMFCRGRSFDMVHVVLTQHFSTLFLYR
jgi:hypothetical protein